MSSSAEDPGYRIEFDLAAKRLSLRLHGFWSDDTAEAFGRELQARITAVVLKMPRFDTLSDASAFPVQSPSVSAKFGSIMHGLGTARRGRIAIVVASTLNKLQAERALGSPAVRVFLTRAEASTWLEGPAGL